MHRRSLAAGAPLAAALAASACSLNPGSEGWPGEPVPAPLAGVREEREPCAERDPLRRAHFGDLHVHTSFSMDANASGTRGTPDDAYRFARGEALAIPPVDAEGRPASSLQLERPLDFAAVTDHAEWLGEVRLCRDPASPAFESRGCRVFRGEQGSPLQWLAGGGSQSRIVGIVGFFGRSKDVCGEGLGQCRAALGSAWGEIRAAAERHYDRSSACTFTTFHAFEYSLTPERSKVHRNVIFRNAAVPELPMSWIDTPTPPELWRKLEQSCLAAGTGCDVITIPHNPNLSNGRLLGLDYRDEPLEEQRRSAQRRAAMDRLVEMMQLKGESECMNGLWQVAGGPDELCDFEKRRKLAPPNEDCRDDTGTGGNGLRGCISRLDFARYALIEGLRERERLGTNPLAFGMIGSTDNHDAAPGSVDEWASPAALGVPQLAPEERRSFDLALVNPGGLAGIYAEENARDSLFDAMRRRETFATSGPRIQPRLFAGWDLPLDLCGRRDLVARGYESGVPMGSDLPRRPAASGAPVFAAAALRDPGTAAHPGGLLERVQIVKGWVGDDGLFHQAVVEVARADGGPAGVDPATCEPVGPGADSLCGSWRDPDFDPARPAVYYARVLENPSCRWSERLCRSLPEGERPAACADPGLPRAVQERAWTSPIWYQPPANPA